MAKNLAPTNTLYCGEELQQGQRLNSTNSQYALVMQEDGNFVEYDLQGNALWAADTKATWQKGFRALMQSDSRLVVQDKSGNELWSSSPKICVEDKYRLVLQNDANAVIFNSKDEPVWSNHAGDKLNSAATPKIAQPN